MGKKRNLQTSKKVVHDFTKRQTVSIPKNVIADTTVSHVILENEDGSFKMVIDREDLLTKLDYDIPISRAGEVIEPKYVHVVE